MRGSWKDGAGSADATFLRPPHILRLIGLMPDRRYAMDLERGTRLYDRVDRASELPMLVLAAAMLPLILIPLLIDLSAGAEAAFWTANWLIWAAFAAELGLKTYLAPSRRQYLVQHWFDVLIVVIPFLRPAADRAEARVPCDCCVSFARWRFSPGSASRGSRSRGGAAWATCSRLAWSPFS